MTHAHAQQLYRPSSNDRSLLLIDDDASAREALAGVLQSHGYRVAECESAAEALALLRQNATPDVIVLDLLMPDMDGWEFRLALLEEPRWQALPVVVLSGDHSPKARAIHARAHLPKPVDHRRLLSLLTEITSPASDHAMCDSRASEGAHVHALMLQARGELNRLADALELARSQCRALVERVPPRDAFTIVGVQQLLGLAAEGAKSAGSIAHAAAEATGLMLASHRTASVPRKSSPLH